MDGRMHLALAALHFTESAVSVRVAGRRLAALGAGCPDRRERVPLHRRVPSMVRSTSAGGANKRGGRGAIRRGMSGAGAPQGAPCPDEHGPQRWPGAAPGDGRRHL